MGWLNHFAPLIQACAAIASLIVLIYVAWLNRQYMQSTKDIAEATRASAEGQARLAEIMQKDLGFRLEPSVQFTSKTTDANQPTGLVKNIGQCPAVDVEVVVEWSPSRQRATVLRMRRLLSGTERLFSMTRPKDDDNYEIEITCTDAASLNNYTFLWSSDGQQLSFEIRPR